MATAANIFGLLMKLGGVVLLFDTPYRVYTDGKPTRVAIVGETNRDALRKRDRLYDRLGNLGLALIFLGTALQIFAALR
jgi:hypothetical protein